MKLFYVFIIARLSIYDAITIRQISLHFDITDTHTLLISHASILNLIYSRYFLFSPFSSNMVSRAIFFP